MSASPPNPPAAPPRRRRPWIALGILMGLLLVLALVGASCLTMPIPKSGSRQTVIYYTAPTDLRPGARLNADELEDRLRRAGYREVEGTPETGEYRSLSGGAEIHLRPFEYPDRRFDGGLIRVRVRGDEVYRVERIGSVGEDEVFLDPERIAGFEGETGAVLDYIQLADAPPLFVKALIAVEDRRFYHHPGIDPVGTMRALWADLRRGSSSQGGSTLTQQLARSLYLHNKKTVARKAQEAVIALGLELRYSKDQILEAYLNAVYWGYWGPMEIRGAREASRYYLGKDLNDADAAGIALLVGLIQAPNAYSPYSSPEKAKARRDLVLRMLAEKGILSDRDAKRAIASSLPSRRPPERVAEASYFLDAVRHEIEQRAPKGTATKPGTAIFTTLDPRDQDAAVKAVREGLRELERDHRSLRKKKSPLQAAVVTLDPASGEVRALVGGRDYLTGPFNRAVDALRQPGSLFKPFVYLAAFRHPDRKDGTFWTAATILKDEPIGIRAGRKIWRPMDYDRQFRGDVTLRYALEHSLNIPTASVGYEVGIQRVAEVAHELGITSDLDEVPSLALGTSGVSLLEITSAYAAIGAGGQARTPTLLRGIIGPTGKTIHISEEDDPPGVDPQECYLVTRLLQGVIESGTGAGARSRGVRGTVAGKTGTTDDYRDAWFVGYTPLRATGVWVGFDRRDPVGLSGASAALPIWATIMKETICGSGDGSFSRPPGIVSAMVCTETGELATGACPDFRDEEFLEGTEPTVDCGRHGGGFFNSVRRFFGI
jgi:penicillin-binding protein 1B